MCSVQIIISPPLTLCLSLTAELVGQQGGRKAVLRLRCLHIEWRREAKEVKDNKELL